MERCAYREVFGGIPDARRQTSGCLKKDVVYFQADHVYSVFCRLCCVSSSYHRVCGRTRDDHKVIKGFLMHLAGRSGKQEE